MEIIRQNGKHEIWSELFSTFLFIGILQHEVLRFGDGYISKAFKNMAPSIANVHGLRLCMEPALLGMSEVCLHFNFQQFLLTTWNANIFVTTIWKSEPHKHGSLYWKWKFVLSSESLFYVFVWASNASINYNKMDDAGIKNWSEAAVKCAHGILKILLGNFIRWI